MDEIHITKEGSVYSYLNRRCQIILYVGEEEDVWCSEIATTIVIPNWAPNFYVCDKHKTDVVKDFLAHLPGKH